MTVLSVALAGVAAQSVWTSSFAPKSWPVLSVCIWLQFLLLKGGWHNLDRSLKIQVRAIPLVSALHFSTRSEGMPKSMPFLARLLVAIMLVDFCAAKAPVASGWGLAARCICVLGSTSTNCSADCTAGRLNTVRLACKVLPFGRPFTGSHG